MSETNNKLDKVIDLQNRTLEEIKSLETKINIIEKRLRDNENEANNLKIECADNTKSIKYQWWVITFIWILVLILFANI